MPCKKRWTQTEEIRTNQKRMEAKMDVRRKEMMASREVTESYPEKMEANPEEIKFIAEHQEVLK
jgi:hypothetical protein